MRSIAKRLVDVLFAGLGIIVCSPVVAVVALAIKLTSPGPVLYWSNRVGRGGALFAMPKFRTMRTGTPAVASHLLVDPQSRLTPIGGFLRRTSLDEIPQLWNVIIGNMSLVGPRPALFNQDDLIHLRLAAGIDRLKPGITGWAQINGRDELPIPEKVAYDREYMERQSLLLDFTIILRTAAKLLGDRTVIH